MARLYLLLLLVDVVLAAYCFIDCVVTPGREIRTLPKAVWLLILFLLWPVAWIAWLAMGRAVGDSEGKHSTSTPGGREAGSGGSGRGGGRGAIRAPDDDLDFLRGLSTGKPPSGSTEGGSVGSGGPVGSGGSRPPQTPRSPSSPNSPRRDGSPPRDGYNEEQFRKWEEDLLRRDEAGGVSGGPGAGDGPALSGPGVGESEPGGVGDAREMREGPADDVEDEK